MLKSLFKKIFNIFNYEIVKKKYSGIIDKRELIPFQYSNEDYKLYFEGLEKSKNKQTDNFHKQSRLLDLIGLVKIVLRQNNVEDFVEAGCWKGHSSYLISKLISNHNKNIKLHIFDSFEGLSKPSMGDEQLNKFKPKEIDNIRVQFSSNEDFVKNGVLRNFKFVHVDVDLYEPTLKTLEFFFPRLIDGGIIACDDYNSKAFDGSKKAWDQYFSNKKVKFNFSPAMGGSFIVK